MLAHPGIRPSSDCCCCNVIRCLYVVLIETGADTTQPDSAVLDYAMCVNKVLRMQRVFLTECENDDCKHPTDTKSTSVPAGGMEGKEASIPASSSFTMDTASVGSSDPPAAESDELTSRLQAAAVHTMDLSN